MGMAWLNIFVDVPWNGSDGGGSDDGARYDLWLIRHLALWSVAVLGVVWSAWYF